MQNLLKPGDIVMADHFDKFQNWSRHPFIIIGLVDQYALGLQFSSVKKGTGKAIGYFDKMILDTMYQHEALQPEEKSFDELWENFFKTNESKFETIDLDHEDGFEYWSRANLNDLYLFDLEDASAYHFDQKSNISPTTFQIIIDKLKKYQWENNIIAKILQNIK
ncbi:hypothetical protein [Spiroplasma sp. SV19]|uniref:hypothetical protein n=1 Tax=Spiroplasma sp. SV19 TaxID=2570468 RepID=UPI0024B71A7F|nr:hypothetical protein [Spiroplasma sp. SV19]WHQ36849.1 hypothetical protein E7Y35_02960 [Spiroplasma sp. SV19]